MRCGILDLPPTTETDQLTLGSLVLAVLLGFKMSPLTVITKVVFL